MSVDTGGPIRGMLGRWLFRMQSVQGIINMVSGGVTAASTLTFALQSIGYAQVAPYVLVVGTLGAPLFAYVYTEYGLFNRKNREGSDKGNNFATPRDKIDDTLIGCSVFAATHGRPPTEDEAEMIEEAVSEKWSEFRDGVEVDG